MFSLIMHPAWTLANVMTAARDLTDSESPFLSLNYLWYDKKWNCRDTWCHFCGRWTSGSHEFRLLAQPLERADNSFISSQRTYVRVKGWATIKCNLRLSYWHKTSHCKNLKTTFCIYLKVSTRGSANLYALEIIHFQSLSFFVNIWIKVV